MTAQELIIWFEHHPFIPFTMTVADGRELVIAHPECAALGKFAAVVDAVHPVGQIEAIDSNLIVSLRTIYKANLAEFFDTRNEPHAT